MKKLIIYILAAMTLLCGCTEISDMEEEAVQASATVSVPEPYPVTVDNLIFNSSPVTVASLSPAVTEIIFELGFGDRLVCRSSYCDYPDEAASVPEAGSSANPDFDKIIKLSPDLLITQSPIANTDLYRLSDSGITVMNIPSPKSEEDLYGIYEKLSLIFAGSIDGGDIAENALSELRIAIDGARGSCGSLAFIMNVTDDGYSAATGDTFAGDYISCFGKNIAENNSSFSLTAEELLQADPQVIFLAHPLGSEDIAPDTASQLSAFKNGHVYVIDASLMERPTSRLAGITNSIAKKVREDTGSSSHGGHAEIPESSETEAESSETSEAESENVNER